MNTKDLQEPRRQLAIGMVLIFFKVSYRFIRSFWGIFAAPFFFDFSEKIKDYGVLIIATLVILGIVYSYFYYRKFLFYIDYENEKFVLNKGVFSSHVIQIPFDKIQQVDLKRSLLQRLIGAYGLSIDTAGSKGDEIEIKALSETDAKKIAAILSDITQQSSVEEPEEEAPTPHSETPSNKPDTSSKDPKLWTHQLSFLTLLKIGLTRSYLRGFVLMIIFVSSVYQQIKSFLGGYFDQTTQYMDTHYTSTLQITVVFIFMLFVVLILSVLVTVGETILKHFDLKIQQTPQQLAVEMGLKTNTKVAFQPRRLQLLKITTNPIQKRLHLYEAQFSLASSQNHTDKSLIVVPGLTPTIIDRIKTFLYPHEIEGQTTQYKPRKNWPNRWYYVILTPFLIFWGFEMFLFQYAYWQLALGGSFCYLLLFMGYAYYFYKTIHMEISPEFLVITRGLWTQKKEIVELYKMEGVTIRQPLWYRQRKIYNLSFHTAGGDVTIRAIPEDFLAHINYILYKIESDDKAWM